MPDELIRDCVCGYECHWEFSPANFASREQAFEFLSRATLAGYWAECWLTLELPGVMPKTCLFHIGSSLVPQGGR